MTRSTEQMSNEEIAYIKRAKAGDDTAFTWLFNKYKDLVLSVLVYHLKDEDEARDMLNVVFLRVFNKLDKFSIYQSFGGWLRILTNRIAIDFLRIKGNQRYTSIEDCDNAQEFTTDEDVEDDTVNRMTASHVFEILDRYRPHVRKIFELHYIQNMPVETVASKLKIPVGTVKSVLSRMRNKVRKQLTKKQ